MTTYTDSAPALPAGVVAPTPSLRTPASSGSSQQLVARLSATGRAAGTYLARLWAWLSDGYEAQLVGNYDLHRLAKERRDLKVADAYRAIRAAWDEYRKTMRHGMETVDYWREL